MNKEKTMNVLMTVVAWMGGALFAGGLYGQHSLPYGGALSFVAGLLLLGLSILHAIWNR